MVVGLWFGAPLPFGACFALIALSAWLNLGLRLALPTATRLAPIWATALLAYDLLQLSGLLYLTGGLQNPFAILLLGPVLVAATALQPDKTFLLGALSLAAATALVFLHAPLPWLPGRPPFNPPLHYVGGVWAALFSALLFMAFYAFRVAEEGRQLADALAATELILQREQHLSALDGLAAAAAHALGTPLATIALVANELSREMAPGDPHADDVALLRSQSQRCRDILASIASLPGGVDEHFGRLPLSHLIEEIVAPHRDFGIALVTEISGEGAEPEVRRNPRLAYALANLVENAVDFAASEVRVAAAWSASAVEVTIADDGAGFGADTLDRLGEPYVTTRRIELAPAGEAANGDRAGSEAHGLGLGIFIAKTLLERSGARLLLANRKPPDRGAVVRIRWPRSAFQTARAEAGVTRKP